MEGNPPQDFLQQGEVNYDELMSNAGWPVAPGEQYTFNAAPPQQAYQQYTTGQPSFDQYQQQPAYTPQYSNSPYTSQYQQHAVHSEAFGPASFSIEPSLQNTPLQNPALYHGSQGSFSFQQEAPTISPQSLQFHATPSQTMQAEAPSPAFQHSVSNYTPIGQDQPRVFFNNTQSAPVQKTAPDPTPTPTQYTPAPSTTSLNYPAKPAAKRSRDGEPVSKPLQQTKAEPQRIKPRLTHPDLYAKNSKAPGPIFKYAPYMTLSGAPIAVPSSVKVPKFPQRKSKLDQENIPGFDLARISAPAQSSSTKIRPPKEKKALVSRYKGTAKPPGDRLTNLRTEDGSLTGQEKQVASQDSSSEEEESSSEEESEDEDTEMSVFTDISTVRGSTRPTNASEAARWDAIGIVWKDNATSPNADVIKNAIEDYGSSVGALRLQLKTNSTKIDEAEKDPAEVARLRQARTVLLDSLYETINAANEHGFGPIVENLGGHEKLVHGLTTTLIECIKADDFLGRLPKAIFRLLAKFKTMSEVLLKRLRFESIQKRWGKKGDDEIKKDIAAILANTPEAKERAAKESKDATRAEEVRKIQEKIEQVKVRKPDALKAAPGAASAKRPHEGDPASVKPNKKFAPDTGSTAAAMTATVKAAPPKRTTNILANNLFGSMSKPAAKPAPKKRELSPPAESKLGALLASISKPPEPPKAPEATPRAPETPEEKKRRERKESRRHLRVKFKDGPELVEVRLFKHEIAEDEGRQDDMLRDAHDDRSEGMMHKKRVSENLDDGLEDEDAVAGDIEERPYPSLVPVDFSGLDKSTTFGPIYTTRGGDKTFSTPEQQTQERREALELMVIYTDPKDIPPSAKEPPQDNKDSNEERQLKGPNEPWILQRLQEIHQYGPDYATQVFFGRKAEERRLKEAQAGSSPNISSILQQLGGPPSSHNPPFSMNATELQNLLRTVDSLKSKPYPPIEPPSWLQNEAQRAEWWAGYNRDKIARGDHVAADTAGHMHPSRFEPHMSAPQMHPYMQQAAQPNMASIPQSTNDVAQQVQAYLANLGTNGTMPATTHQQFDFNSLSTGHGWDAERENAAARSKQYQDSHNSNGKQRGHETKQWSGGHDNDSLFDENGEYKGKKKPCKFWGQGKCTKGAKCTFLHDTEE